MVNRLSELGAGVGRAWGTVGALTRSGLLRPIRPDRLKRMIDGTKRWGPTAAGVVAMAAARHPDRVALIDETGSLTWAGLDARTDALAHGLREQGAGPDAAIGLLCRNNRSFVETLVAAAKAGADVVLLNTGFAAPQLREVATREGVRLLVHDESFTPVVDAALSVLTTEPAPATPDPSELAPDSRATARDPGAGTDGSTGGGAGPTAAASIDRLVAPRGLDALVAAAPAGPPEPPARHGGVTILSSGTTGTPKGAHRSPDSGASRGSAASQLGILTRVPLRSGAPALVSAPLFHTWGLSGFLMAAVLASPVVLRERFDARDVLATLERERIDTVVAVPVMLQRILDLPESERAGRDTSSLRLVFLSGSALPGDLAVRWMDAMGDNLYNLYGSTEVAAVAVADPADLRAAPDSAGPVVPGIDVRLLDDDDREVPSGSIGRIFVRSGMLFEGYTGGGTKPVVDGYMSTGDLGRIDADGRLHVEGREDDMLITGGENVQPQEIEDVLDEHDGVVESVVVGLPDDELGQRLVAFVVPAGAGAPPDPQELRSWVRDRLAGFKVPKEVRFLDRLPRNPTGKVVRRALVDADVTTPLED